MHTIGGGDSLVLMPTGGGKSLCFQMSALLMDGMAVIVSPLISLMKDQVEGLRMNGIAAEALNSSNDEGYNRDIINRCVEGKVKMLYISPERLIGGVLAILQTAHVSMFAIDEAHCISGWGHDFRPEYTQLGQLKQLFPHVPIMALTATADKITKEDILVQLNIQDAKTYISSFDRPNLSLDVKRGYSARDKLRSIEELIRRHPQESGIIYCLARKTTETLAANGPAWSNSLFENNAEFSLGMALSVRQQREAVREMVRQTGAPVYDAEGMMVCHVRRCCSTTCRTS